LISQGDEDSKTKNLDQMDEDNISVVNYAPTSHDQSDWSLNIARASISSATMNNKVRTFLMSIPTGGSIIKHGNYGCSPAE